MCRSVAEGGQRCASHAKNRLDVRVEAVRALFAQARDPETGVVGAIDEVALADARAQWDEAAVEYASTPAGEREFVQRLHAARSTGDVDGEAVVMSVLKRGLVMREANAQAAAVSGRSGSPRAESPRAGLVGSG